MMEIPFTRKHLLNLSRFVRMVIPGEIAVPKIERQGQSKERQCPKQQSDVR